MTEITNKCVPSEQDYDVVVDEDPKSLYYNIEDLIYWWGSSEDRRSQITQKYQKVSKAIFDLFMADKLTFESFLEYIKNEMGDVAFSQTNVNKVFNHIIKLK